MKKKQTAQNGAKGISARPSGYATNARPGPATDMSHDHHNKDQDVMFKQTHFMEYSLVCLHCNHLIVVAFS